MAAGALKDVRSELVGLRMAIRVHDSMPESNHQIADLRMPQGLAAAVGRAVQAGYSAEVAALLAAERANVPQTGRDLWNRTLTAGETALSVGMPGAIPTPYVARPAFIAEVSTTAVAQTPAPESTVRRAALIPGLCAACGAPVQVGHGSCGRCGAAIQPEPLLAPLVRPPSGPHPQGSPGPPHGMPSPYPQQYPSYAPVLSGANPGRTLLAHGVLWGGLLLVAYLVTTSAFLRDTSYGYYGGGGGGLHLGVLLLDRLKTIALYVAPYLIAAALVAGTLRRWMVAALAVLIAAIIQYVFWFSTSSATWVMSVVIVAVLFGGWLGARARPRRATWLLLPVVVLAVLFYVPEAPGRWLQSIPFHAGWTTPFAFSAWEMSIFAVAGLVGLFAARGSSPYVPASPVSDSWTGGALVVAGIGVVALITGVIAQTSYVHNVQYRSPASYPTPYPTDQASTYSNGNGYTQPSFTSSDAQLLAASAFDAMAGNGYVNTCGGSLPSLAVSRYTIDQVSPTTGGSFYVSASVTLNDGSTETVSYLVGTDTSAQPCVEVDSIQQTLPVAAAPVEPSDVPSVPSTGDPVPSNAALPSSPGGSVVSYTDSATTPTTTDQLVEWQPSGLDADQTAAVQDVIAFMTYVNQQDFQSAWTKSTESLSGPAASSNFQAGYNTSRFYQVAFGQPKKLASDLIVIPARFVSRQDPAAQGNPSGVTDCTYWPQYVFVVAKSGGVWLDDVAGSYAGRPELAPLKRVGSDGGTYLNPVSQRVGC